MVTAVDNCILKPSETYNPRFIVYQLSSASYLEYMEYISRGGTRSRISRLMLGDIRFVVPIKKEQDQIAIFLDRKTLLIDRLIEKKQKLIELLKEQRTAIINQAVTKGLDPNVKMKDSGIEWLGEVPSKWEIRKVSRSFHIIGSGTTPSSDNINFYNEGTIPWIVTGDLNDGILISTSKKLTQSALNIYSTLRMYPKGTLIIALYGATIGKLSILDIDACTNQACCALNKSPYFEIKYIFYWFLVNRQNIISLAYGGGQPNISQDLIKSLKIICPPIKEQRLIIEYLNSKTKIIDNQLEKTKKSIEFLKDYRTTLISEVVTGKVDVRGIPN